VYDGHNLKTLWLCLERATSVPQKEREKFLEKQRLIYIRQQTLIGKTNEADLPEFSNLLKQFYKRAHPDLIRSSRPELADVNTESLQLLNGVLSTLKENKEYPPLMKKRIPFHLKIDNGEFSKIELHVNIAGGDCKRSLSRSFQTFFQDAGICETQFSWGKDYFENATS